MKIDKINRQSIGISGFTSVLETIHTPPTELFVAGSLPKEKRICVAIIGSRTPTAYGVEVTHKLAYDLAKQGILIISGLAYGVDAVAHRAALEAGGTTIAILANGLHRIYPASHTSLAHDIVKQGGALISEKAPGEDARQYDFLKRNRLISGLADAVVVTEATEKSGTLSTVGHALDQNKEVFAVPGPITSLLSAGPNVLIQQGAQVVLSAQDILTRIAPGQTVQQSLLPLGDTPLEVLIIELLQKQSASTESILTALPDESTADILQTITLMEVKGTIHARDGRFYI